MTNPSARQAPFSLVVISAGTSDPSSTRMLADRAAARVAALAGERGEQVTISVVDLREIATEVSTALVAQFTGPRLEKAVAALHGADGIIAATPVVVDEQIRALFAYLRALTVPTSLFAAPEDWGDAGLNQRIDRAALELLFLMESGFAQKVKDQSWDSYQHEYGSRAAAADAIDAINLDSDLMRLATGGSAG